MCTVWYINPVANFGTHPLNDIKLIQNESEGPLDNLKSIWYDSEPLKHRSWVLVGGMLFLLGSNSCF